MEFRRFRALGLLVVTILFWTSCSNSLETADSSPEYPNTILSPGDYTRSLSLGGADRSYILHVPAGYDGSSPLPLVLVLHGYGGTAQSMLHSTQFNVLADQESFF